MEKIAKNITKLRTMKGLTQDDLAEKLDVTRQTIFKWEKGKSVPRGGNLKLLCEILGVTMDQLLGKAPLNLDKKIEIAIDELKTNLKEEEIETKKNNKKVIIKKVRNIVLILLIVITFIYASCTAYKFAILTHIGNKVSKYENLNNYYCEIETYDKNYLKEKENIWYKDKKYKIERYTYNDVGQTIAKTTNIINLEENTLSTYNNDEYKSTVEIIDEEKYKNGQYMYNLFPDMIKNKLSIKLNNAFKINLLKFRTIKENNIKDLRINSQKVELDKELYTPIFYTNGENNENNRKHFKIELDSVEDEDLAI